MAMLNSQMVYYGLDGLQLVVSTFFNVYLNHSNPWHPCSSSFGFSTIYIYSIQLDLHAPIDGTPPDLFRNLLEKLSTELSLMSSLAVMSREKCWRTIGIGHGNTIDSIVWIKIYIAIDIHH